MPPRLRAALATGAHALVVLIVATLATRGLHVRADVAGYAETGLIAAGMGAWAAGLHWLATRKGTSLQARAARRTAAILSLGAGTLAPANPAA